MSVQPLHDHVPHGKLQILGNLHFVHRKVNSNIGEHPEKVCPLKRLQ